MAKVCKAADLYALTRGWRCLGGQGYVARKYVTEFWPDNQEGVSFLCDVAVNGTVMEYTAREIQVQDVPLYRLPDDVRMHRLMQASHAIILSCCGDMIKGTRSSWWCSFVTVDTVFKLRVSKRKETFRASEWYI